MRKLTPEQKEEMNKLPHGLTRAAYPYSLMSLEELEEELQKETIFDKFLNFLKGVIQNARN